MARSTVVLLPGLLCDSTVWVSQRSAMPDADCFVPDYGLLSSIPDMARRVLHEVQGDRLRVVGHSMGGRVALEMARLAPQRIERLALLDSGVTARPLDGVGQAEERQRLELVQLAREKGMREMGRRWARGMVHPAHVDTPVFEAILDMIERKTLATYEAQITALLARPDARSVLGTLRCPTLLLCGRQDQWSPLARHQQMHEALPGSTLEVVEDSGHMTTMEQPDAVNAALCRWMEA